MPAYSTWQPTEGKIPPTASADQSATRRLVAPRGDPMRGNPIASTLLGIFGGPLTQSFKEPGPPEGTPWGVLVYPAQPERDNLSKRLGRPFAGQAFSAARCGRRASYLVIKSAGSTG